MNGTIQHPLVPVTLNLVRQLFSLSSIFILAKSPRGELEVVGLDSEVESAVAIGSVVNSGPLIEWSLLHRKGLVFKLSERGYQHASGLYRAMKLTIDGVMLIPAQLSDGTSILYWCDATSSLSATTERMNYVEEYLAHVTACLKGRAVEATISPQGSIGGADESVATYSTPDEFSRSAQRMVQSSTTVNFELVRFVPKNLIALEELLGVVSCVNLYDQTLKRIAQIFPKGTPLLKLPDGAILALVDAMLVGLYSNRIKSICALTHSDTGKHFEFDSFKAGLRQASAQGATVVQIIDQFNTNKAVVRDLLAANS